MSKLSSLIINTNKLVKNGKKKEKEKEEEENRSFDPIIRKKVRKTRENLFKEKGINDTKGAFTMHFLAIWDLK